MDGSMWSNDESVVYSRKMYCAVSFFVRLGRIMTSLRVIHVCRNKNTLLVERVLKIFNF